MLFRSKPVAMTEQGDHGEDDTGEGLPDGRQKERGDVVILEQKLRASPGEPPEDARDQSDDDAGSDFR